MLCGLISQGQIEDSVNSRTPDSVYIISGLKRITIQSLPDIKRTYIFAGKKSSVINLDESLKYLRSEIFHRWEQEKLRFAEILPDLTGLDNMLQAIKTQTKTCEVFYQN